MAITFLMTTTTLKYRWSFIEMRNASLCTLLVLLFVSSIFCLVQGLQSYESIFSYGKVSYPADHIYYVAKDGSDSYDGSEVHPWRTIQKAASTLVAGDHVYIKAGIYNEKVIPLNSGTPENYITYAAYSDDEVTIDGTGTSDRGTWGGLFDVSDKSYIKISGLRIINSPVAGIFACAASHIIVENCYAYNTYSSGIGFWDSDNIIIVGNEVELACNGGGEECITVSGVNVFEVKNNYVHDPGRGPLGGEGIDIKESSCNGKVYGNTVAHGRPCGIYVDAWDGHLYNVEVFQNVIYDIPDWGIALATEAGGNLENIKVYNNIVYGCYHGLAVYEYEGTKRDLYVINNNFYNNIYVDWYIGIGVFSSVTNFILRNNIIYKSGGISAEYPIVEDHNLVDIDPLFVDASNGNFHLKSGSPAIDNGSSINAPSIDFDGTPRPQGAAFDIGAFEFV